MWTDDETKRQLVHTLAHANVFIVLIYYLQNFGGAIYLPPFFSNSQANKRQACPSCDEPPTNLKVMVGVKARNKNHSQGGGPCQGP